MANITLSIDDELLNRGRSYARARGTSLNSLVRKLLVDHRGRSRLLHILNTISFRDGLIVASASAAKCAELISEDLADGQIIQGIAIKNPFC